MKNLAFGLGVWNPGGGRAIAVLVAALLIVALAAMACMDDSESTDESSSDAAVTGSSGGTSGTSASSSASSGAASSSAASGQSAQSSQSSGAASSAASGPDSTVSAVNQNPSGAGPELDYSQNAALRNATPIDAVNWTTPPTVGGGSLSGAGTIAQGTDLFDPTNGDGATFAVYYSDHEDPMVVILPDLGPMELWNTTHTVADMDWEREATSFTFRAYSPLFMDAGGELELHVFGYDADGNDALLSVTKIGAGQGASGQGMPPLPTPVAASGQSGASSGSSGASSAVVSAVNQNPTGAGPLLEYGQNDALRNATPLDAVNWTEPPTIGAGALSATGEFTQDVNPFDPTVGEGAAFAVYFVGQDEPLVVLLPSLGPAQIWNSDHTVAEMEYELNWPLFTFRAYSPLFMDMGGDLELLVFGFDADYNEAVLSAVGVGN